MPSAMDSKSGHLRLEKARWRLAVIWFPSCGLLFLILVAQSIGGAYGDELQRAWGWALPNFLPTLALMVSVFTADALTPLNTTATYVRTNFCNLAIGLSIFYILVILISLVAQPFAIEKTEASNLVAARLQFLEMSNLWLAPLQGLVVAALGVLFFRKNGESAK